VARARARAGACVVQSIRRLQLVAQIAFARSPAVLREFRQGRVVARKQARAEASPASGAKASADAA
jgi:hypothetical protein